MISTPAFHKSINFTGNADLLTFIVAGILLGDVVGCIIVTPFVHRLGRRFCIIFACYVGLIGVILQTSTFSAEQMIVGRILLGIGNGIISAIVPAFVQESAVGTEHGRSQDILITVGYGVVGIAVSNWIDYGVYRTSSLNAWRGPIAAQAFFLIAALIVFHGVMESPRWLYSKHRDAEADESLSRLLDLPIDAENAQGLKQEILASVRLEEQDAEDSLTVKHLFKDESHTRVATRIWLSWVIALGAPLFGGNVIIFYSSSIFAALGLDEDNVEILTASLQTATPFGMMFAFYLLPRFGRLPLLIGGGTGQLIMMVVFTVLSNLGSHTTAATQWAAVACLFVYQFVNGLTWIWLPYLYAVEIVPTRYRGQVIAIGNASFWLVAFIEVYAAPIALSRATGAKIFIWFCLGGAVVLATVIALAKETKGLSLEQIDLLWASDEYRNLNQEAKVIEGKEIEERTAGGDGKVEYTV